MRSRNCCSTEQGFPHRAGCENEWKRTGTMRDDETQPEQDVEMSEARIQSQLKYVQDELMKTRELVGLLEDRIDPILLPRRASKTEVASPMPLPSSEMSLVLDEMARTIHELQGRVSRTIERVQL